MIKFRVQWPNASHPLLASPTMVVAADGVELSPTGVQLGVQDFEIPDGTATLDLAASFTAVLPVDGPKGSTRNFILFDARQSYSVDGDGLTAVQATLVSGDRFDTTRTVHPLIQTVSAANAASGAALVELRTEFLDLTRQWLFNASGFHAMTRLNDTEPDNTFVALAATGSQPPLWFAHFQKDLTPPTPETSALVFFRPSGHYTYVNAFDPVHRDRGLADLNRYLLAPKDNKPTSFDGQNFFVDVMRFPFANPPYALRVGWQQAVLRSGKPVVVFHPWPTGGLVFGDALTSKLPTLLEQMMRFLQGTGRLGVSHPSLTLGRLGVAGFSAGGPPAASAMKANRSLVKEMYLFDPFPFLPQIPFVIDWAFKTRDFRLRMTGANFWGQMATIKAAVTAGVTGEAGDAFVTLRPASPTMYLPEDKGGGKYWNYVTHKFPALRFDFNVQHQFAAFGGEEIEVGDDENMVSNVTWLEEFLTNSGF